LTLEYLSYIMIPTQPGLRVHRPPNLTTECMYDTQGVRGKISEIGGAVNLLILH